MAASVQRGILQHCDSLPACDSPHFPRRINTKYQLKRSAQIPQNLPDIHSYRQQLEATGLMGSKSHITNKQNRKLWHLLLLNFYDASHNLYSGQLLCSCTEMHEKEEFSLIRSHTMWNENRVLNLIFLAFAFRWNGKIRTSSNELVIIIIPSMNNQSTLELLYSFREEEHGDKCCIMHGWSLTEKRNVLCRKKQGNVPTLPNSNRKLENELFEYLNFPVNARHDKRTRSTQMSAVAGFCAWPHKIFHVHEQDSRSVLQVSQKWLDESASGSPAGQQEVRACSERQGRGGKRRGCPAASTAQTCWHQLGFFALAQTSRWPLNAHTVKIKLHTQKNNKEWD